MNTSAFPRRAHLWVLTLALLAAMSPTSYVTAGSCGDTYTVAPGDSLWSISATCDVPIATLTRLNQISTHLQPGQVLHTLTHLNRLSAHLQSGRMPQMTDPSAPPSAPRMYVVQSGDTLSGIAQRLDLTPATLAAENGIPDLDIVRAGSVLRWRPGHVQTMVTARPAPAAASATTSGHVCASVTYTVQPGDTLSTIATTYHVDVAALAAANGIADPNVLLAGDTLCIPPATAASPAAPRPSTTTTNVTMRTYVVRPGDTLSGIGRALGLTAQALARANGLALTMPIRPAQVLRYPVSVSTGPLPTQVGASTGSSLAQVGASTGSSLAQVGAVLDQQAVAVGVDSALLKAVAWRESNWRMVDAPDGGIGVMQLMPDTVRWLKQDYIPGTWDPHDLTANVHAGAVLLLLYSRLYSGDVARIVAAYHGGMGALLQPYATAEMARYVGTVIAYRRAFLNGTFPS